MAAEGHAGFSRENFESVLVMRFLLDRRNLASRQREGRVRYGNQADYVCTGVEWIQLIESIKTYERGLHFQCRDKDPSIRPNTVMTNIE